MTRSRRLKRVAFVQREIAKAEAEAKNYANWGQDQEAELCRERAQAYRSELSVSE